MLVAINQVFEGIALAMASIEAGFNNEAVTVLVAMFSSSLPFGIAIGIASTAWADADEDSKGLTSVMLQAVPNAIAAGMLGHIGFELMVQDFSHCHSESAWVKVRKCSLLAFGGFVMCFLGIWA